MTNMADTFNKDGSLDIPVDGKPVRYVKESDLLAVKSGSETKQKEWDGEKVTFTTQVGDLTKLRDEAHANLLKEQAVREQLTEKYKDYDTHKNRVGELAKELETHKGTVGKYEKELTDRIKSSLIATYSIQEDTFKDKTLEQLRNIEETAKLIGKPAGAKPANYDKGGGGTGGIVESRMDRAKRIIDEQEQRQGKIKVGAK